MVREVVSSDSQGGAADKACYTLVNRFDIEKVNGATVAGGLRIWPGISATGRRSGDGEDRLPRVRFCGIVAAVSNRMPLFQSSSGMAVENRRHAASRQSPNHKT